MLSDRDIRAAMKTGDVIIDDFDENRLQPASYDLLLGYEFLVFDNTRVSYIDPSKSVDDYTRKVTLKNKDDFIILHPREFMLGVTHDRVGTGAQHCCELMGKSSLARLGLIVHTTAGFIDPGNVLNITLEMVNFNTVPLKLHPLMKIGQVGFHKLDSPCERTYGHKDLNSKYYGSNSVEASKMHRNY